MDIGMLWFDNTPNKPLDKKVQEAAAFYAKKYGRTPNLAFVNPATSSTQAPIPSVEDVTIITSKTILPNHIWIGVKS